MHWSLAFGSIGARAKLIGIASHHHPAAIAPREIRRSASGVRSEISFVIRAGIVDWLETVPRFLDKKKSASARMLTCESWNIYNGANSMGSSGEPKPPIRHGFLGSD